MEGEYDIVYSFLELVLLTDESRVVVKSPKFRGRTQKSRLS